MECACKTKIYGNLWTKEMKFNKIGDIKEGHKHTHDHITFVTSGAVEVFILEYQDNKKRVLDTNPKSLGIFTAPAYIEVPKEVSHRVVATANNTVAYCIQAIRDGGEIVETDFASGKEICQKTDKILDN